MKQTAVEWLVRQLIPSAMATYDPTTYNVIQQAKEIEKEQIIDANIAGMEFIPVDSNRYQEDAEQYYSETFNSNG